MEGFLNLMAGLNRTIKTVVKTILRPTSYDTRHTTMYRGTKTRQRPSIADLSAKVCVKATTVMLMKPPKLSENPATQIQSWKRFMKGARSACALSTRKRYLGNAISPWLSDVRLQLSITVRLNSQLTRYPC